MVETTELDMAEQLVDALSDEFGSGAYGNEHRGRLMEASLRSARTRKIA